MSHWILSALIVLLSMPFTLIAQGENIGNDGSQENVTYNEVEEMPQFPGGEAELFRFISTNIEYPDLAIKAGIQGVVYVVFVVDVDGTIQEAEILRGIGGGCDEEALRLVNAMPTWKPGKEKGENVRVRFNMPIRFTLMRKKDWKKGVKRPLPEKTSP